MKQQKTKQHAPSKGEVRIIAGRWRGRKLPVVADAGIRPSGDRVRETLFNWLRARIVGSRCLDLFAGSGALGFEAASRGAREVWMVERPGNVAANLREQKQRLDADSVHIACLDASEFLRTHSLPFDVIFLDPPFDRPSLDEDLRMIKDRGLLAESGAVYLECAADDWPPTPGFVAHRQARAGEVRYGLLVAVSTAVQKNNGTC
jgi:16S rRNA (guanine966-N2)-methyltransferase